MSKILALGLIGFFAQLIDGALGMAYGVSSTTLLLTLGISAAGASATVHLASEDVTAGLFVASGIAWLALLAVLLLRPRAALQS